MQDFVEEQNLVARLIHQLVVPDFDEQFAIYVAARKCFSEGGPRRLAHTLPRSASRRCSS